jgi:hypothetical protein
MGRASIFRDKEGGDRVQGVITKDGSKAFEAARKRLALLARRPVTQVSDADTIEFLARGERSTERYLAAHDET